jgi:tetratricopeptide (TPR) repeat protein
MMLLPVLGFVWMALLQETPGADWWQYLAAPGIFACVAGGAVTASRKWRMITPLLAVAVALLAVQTWRRATIYQSLETYCRAVTAEDPRAWTLQNNLGIMLKREGRFAEAEACYHRALLDNPGYVEAHINLGNALAAAGDPAAAEAEYRQAAQIRPGDPSSLQALADLLSAEGRTDEALTFEAGAVKAGPGNVANLYKLGQMLVGKGRFADAESCFRDAAALAPDSIPVRIELCQTLVVQAKRDAALQVCSEVDQLARKSGDPSDLEAAAQLRRHCEAPGATSRNGSKN